MCFHGLPSRIHSLSLRLSPHSRFSLSQLAGVSPLLSASLSVSVSTLSSLASSRLLAVSLYLVTEAPNAYPPFRTRARALSLSSLSSLPLFPSPLLLVYLVAEALNDLPIECLPVVQLLLHRVRRAVVVDVDHLGEVVLDQLRHQDACAVMVGGGSKQGCWCWVLVFGEKRGTTSFG